MDISLQPGTLKPLGCTWNAISPAFEPVRCVRNNGIGKSWVHRILIQGLHDSPFFSISVRRNNTVEEEKRSFYLKILTCVFLTQKARYGLPERTEDVVERLIELSWQCRLPATFSSPLFLPSVCRCCWETQWQFRTGRCLNPVLLNCAVFWGSIYGVFA